MTKFKAGDIVRLKADHSVITKVHKTDYNGNLVIQKLSNVVVNSDYYELVPETEMPACSGYTFQITFGQAKKLIARLELDSSWDKVGDVYYELKKFVDEHSRTKQVKKVTEKSSFTLTGTNCFTDVGAAIDYYYVYGFSRGDVLEKINEGEIQIGAPKAKPGEKVRRNSREGRYYIESYK